MQIETLIEILGEVREQRDHLEKLIYFIAYDYKYGAGNMVADRKPICGVPTPSYQLPFLDAVEQAYKEKEG